MNQKEQTEQPTDSPAMMEKKSKLEELHKSRYFPHALHSREHIRHMINTFLEYEPKTLADFRLYDCIIDDTPDFVHKLERLKKQVITLGDTYKGLRNLVIKYNEDNPDEEPLRFERTDDVVK